MSTGQNSGRSIAIVGGGIAGLTAALCFARTGATVTVFEQAKALKEVGAGLQITPNGASVLHALGLSAKADKQSIRGASLVPTDALSGKAIARFDLTALAGQPYRFFHRADLLALLEEACLNQGVEIRTDARGLESESGALRLEDGTTVAADLIVGADGLHSVTRQSLNGADKPFFTGQVAWRSVVQARDAEPEARIWMAPGKHVVTYPLIGGRMNVVAVQERSDWTAEGWHYFDEPANVREAFSDCDDSLLDIIDRMQTVRLWGLFRHRVAPRWHGGGRVILGDAAHPTLPFLAQGANLAIEDAYVLADCLDRHADIARGCGEFQSRRFDRVNRAIATANGNAVNYHLSGLKRVAGQGAIRLIGATAPSLFLKRFDWLYRHDVVNDGA